MSFLKAQEIKVKLQLLLRSVNPHTVRNILTPKDFFQDFH